MSFDKVARENDYKLHRLPTCPARFLWSSTMKVVSNALFLEALGNEDLPADGGLLNQPANWLQAIRHARAEIGAFQNICAIARAEKKSAKANR